MKSARRMRSETPILELGELGRLPVEGVAPRPLLCLQQEPDTTAKAFLGRLRPLYPGRFTDGQLQTLQQGRSLRWELTPQAKISVTFPMRQHGRQE